MFKKILIIICLTVALLMMFLPIDEIRAFVNEMNGVGSFWRYPIAFYCASTVFLFWVGISAGYRLARDNFWGTWGIIIASLVGLYLSLPIAIVQLLKPRH